MTKGQALSDLIRRAAQSLAAAYTKQEPALTLPQSSVLRALLRNGPMTQTRMREVLFMDRSTMSELLKRLATDSLVTNAQVESDMRAFLVTITPAGRKALVRAEGAASEAEARVMMLVPRTDRAGFRRALQAIADGKPSE